MVVKIKRVKNNALYNKIELAIGEALNYQTKVGWFKENNYPEEDGGLPVAEVAATQEFGDAGKHIPPRPHMRIALVKSQSQLKKLVDAEAKKILVGASDVKRMMELVGMQTKTAVADSIVSLFDPALSPVTIRRRAEKFKKRGITRSLTKPLVDSGRMLATVDYNVTEVSKP